MYILEWCAALSDTDFPPDVRFVLYCHLLYYDTENESVVETHNKYLFQTKNNVLQLFPNIFTVIAKGSCRSTQPLYHVC